MKSPCFTIHFLLVILITLLACSDDPVAGGSGTDIVCKVYDSNFDVIKNAEITFKPTAYIHGLSKDSNWVFFSGTTDSNGIFKIECFDTINRSHDKYTVTIKADSNTGTIRSIDFTDERIFESEIKNNGLTILELHDFFVYPNGKAYGHIANGPKNELTGRAIVYVPGTEYHDTTNDNGEYKLDSLPIGDGYSLGFYDIDSTEKIVEIEDVQINSGDSVYLDTISLNGLALLHLQNNFPNRLDTLYSLNTPVEKNYITFGDTDTITTPTLFNNFQFVKWEKVSGSVSILSDSSSSTAIRVDSNSIIKAIYKDIQAPDSIKNINVQVLGNQATITWSPTSDNDTILQYMIIYRYQSDSSIIDTFNYTDTIAFFEGLYYQNTTYSCTLKAIDPSGNATAPQLVTFKTLKDDSTPPVFNSEIKIHKLNSTYASVFWNPAVDELGIKKYEVMINNDPNYAEFKTECFHNGDNLTPGDTFNIKVRAYDYYENVSEWIETDVILPLINDTLAPSIPAIDSSSTSGQDIYFSWTPSIDNVTDTVTYEIKYEIASDTTGQSEVFINVKNAEEYTISGLISNTDYKISIRAFDLAWYYSDVSSVILKTE